MKHIHVLTIAEPANLELLDAYAVLLNTHASVNSFLEAFKDSRAKAKKGTTTDREQDLLRAMLLFACAGLDATVKQLISDALTVVIQKNENAQRQFGDFIEKKIKQKAAEPNDFTGGAKTLARALSSSDPQKTLINELIKELGANSLQSVDQLLEAASYFAITKSEVIDDIDAIKKAFQARNAIAHEMDIDFSRNNRSRTPRAQKEMFTHISEILKVAEKFITNVGNRLTA